MPKLHELNGDIESVDSVVREMLTTLRRARKLMPSYSGYFTYILGEMDDIIAKAERVLEEVSNDAE